MLQYILASILLLVLDIVWIMSFMGGQYNRMIPLIQKKPMKPRIGFAILAYILMIVGLCLFVIPNIRKDYVLQDSLLYGFGFGLVLYGVYDFTAAAVISDWDLSLSVIDMLWGGFVYFLSSFIAVLILSLYDSKS